MKYIFTAFLTISLIFSSIPINLFAPVKTYANETNTKKEDASAVLADSKLHAKYAVIMDADSKRVLYGKNPDEQVPMASTTKTMSCVIALEYGADNLSCTTSAYAASMPDVQLNAKKGEVFSLSDLLYSLMLKSHNDTAVIIAENVAYNYIYEVRTNKRTDTANILSDKNLDFVPEAAEFNSSFLATINHEQSKLLVSVFTGLMNRKAQDLGCTHTNFITPNGLDAANESGVHSTTAKELAIIMSYCIKNEQFLKVTQTANHAFSSKQIKKDGSLQNGSSYNVSNANAFLNMYDHIISGKTGFTGDAGYCYTCAYQCEGRTFVVALLACGWPNNKTYKWQDSRLLLNWAKENFFWKDIITKDFSLKNMTVLNGTTSEIPVYIDKTYGLLLSDNDRVNVVMNIPETINAPVNVGDVVGSVCVYINDELSFTTYAYAKEAAIRTDYKYFLKIIAKLFCFIDK